MMTRFSRLLSQNPIAALVCLSLATLGACDDTEDARPATAYDIDTDVDFEDDYADGEEPPTVAQSAVGWEATRNLTEADGLARQCFLDILTGPLPNGNQLSFVRGATYCGPLEFTVGYVDAQGAQRSTSTQVDSSVGWWQQMLEIDLNTQRGNRYANYARVCLLETGQCFGIYR